MFSVLLHTYVFLLNYANLCFYIRPYHCVKQRFWFRKNVHKIFYNIPKYHISNLLYPLKLHTAFIKKKPWNPGFWVKQRKYFFGLRTRLHITRTRRNLLQLLFFPIKTHRLTRFINLFRVLSPLQRHLVFHRSVLYNISHLFFVKASLLRFNREAMIFKNSKPLRTLWDLLVPGDFIQLQWRFELVCYFFKLKKFRYLRMFYWHRLYFLMIKHFIFKHATRKTSFKYAFYRHRDHAVSESIYTYIVDLRSMVFTPLYVKSNYFDANRWVNWQTFNAYNWKYTI